MKKHLKYKKTDSKNLVLYICIAGAGFLLDFLIYSFEIRILEMNPGVSNYISATISATIVFILSNILLFKYNNYNYILYYVIYTEINIIFWSILITKFISISLSIGMDFEYIDLIAKTFITPFSLLLNYMITSKLAKISHNV